MQKSLVIAAMAAFLATTSFMAPSVAIAKSATANKAQVQDCKTIADKKKRGECVSKAAKAKGVSTKADTAVKKGMDKAKGKKK